VGYALGGELLFVQLGVIIIVFYLSFKMWKNKNLINDLKNNLDKIDNQNFSSKINNISNKQIKVLSTPKEHRKFLLKSLNQANKTIVIFSGWLTDYSVNDEFRTKIKSCLDRGVDIIIAWGYKKSGSISSEQKNAGEKSIRDLQEWTSLNKTKGTLETFYFPNHSKILICDTQYAVMGSFNWLSNSGGSTNEERSWIVYNTDFIQDEIVEIMKNLYNPNKSLSRRQLLKNFVPFSRY
jgi:phosphatidylserine/phosphatidylglycerophosphate/cardiolipin synthase-like enzyme